MWAASRGSGKSSTAARLAAELSAAAGSVKTSSFERAPMVAPLKAALDRRPRRDPPPLRGSRRRRPRVVREAVLSDGSADPRAVRCRHRRNLSARQPDLGRAPGAGRGRRLWARRAGALFRYRSVVPAALQADPAHRAGRRVPALSAVGSGAQGRPCDALGRRMPAPGEIRPDHPHRVCSRRAICGATQALFGELKKRFDAEIVRGTAAQFVEAKLAERDERHRRVGDSRYQLEPNVKEGKGGLRDLHTLFWLAKYIYRIDDVAKLVELGVLSAEESQRFARAQSFLWTVRCHLHYPHRPRRGAADLRPAERDRAAHGLHRPRRQPRRRALHEALFPGRQGCRRPDPHLLRDPRSRSEGQAGGFPGCAGASADAGSTGSCSMASG